MRFLLSALIALGAVLCALPVSAKDIDWTNVSEEFALQQWAQFKRTYEKDYGNADEEAHRFQIFQDNMARARVLNAMNPDATFGIAPFADMDPSEFKSRLGARPPVGGAPASEIKRLSPALKTDDAPKAAPPTTSIDWRGKAVSAIKDQGSCGSCWAFSATETVESAYFMKYGFESNYTLSPQQLVDCDPVSEGCDGGWPYWAFDYIQKAGGQDSESAYPYTGVDGTCKFKAGAVEAKISGWSYVTPECNSTKCPNQDEQTLFNSLQSLGPISICVDAEPWQLYAGGILKEGCPSGYDTIDHCVQLVGYNPSQGGYWIARNSWGTSWGINGYIYLAFGHNVCGLADQATFPKIE